MPKVLFALRNTGALWNHGNDTDMTIGQLHVEAVSRWDEMQDERLQE